MKDNNANSGFKALKDDDLMPYGQYKGLRMVDVPASYLLWLSDNDKCSKQVRAYITDNMETLCKQAGRPVPEPWWKLRVQQSKYQPK